MGVRSSMAREPTSIIEAFACHPSAVVEIREDWTRNSWTWHGNCVIAGADWVKRTLMANAEERTIFVHEHLRDYLADSEGASDDYTCQHCGNKLRYLPRGFRYE